MLPNLKASTPRDAWAEGFAICGDPEAPYKPFQRTMRALDELVRGPRQIVIMDIDGTLANAEHRLHLLPKNRPDVPVDQAWDEFFAAAVDDVPNEEIVELSNILSRFYPVFVMTGRKRSDEQMTRTWLRWTGVHFHCLMMRASDDRRADTIVKSEMLAQVRADGAEPLFAVEDRAEVAAMFRAAGVRVLHVCEGKY